MHFTMFCTIRLWPIIKLKVFFFSLLLNIFVFFFFIDLSQWQTALFKVNAHAVHVHVLRRYEASISSLYALSFGKFSDMFEFWKCYQTNVFGIPMDLHTFTLETPLFNKPTMRRLIDPCLWFELTKKSIATHFGWMSFNSIEFMDIFWEFWG